MICTEKKRKCTPDGNKTGDRRMEQKLFTEILALYKSKKITRMPYEYAYA